MKIEEKMNLSEDREQISKINFVLKNSMFKKIWKFLINFSKNNQ